MMALDAFSMTECVQPFLAHCHRRHYAPKTAIIRQGDRADELFYIISGSVTVLLEDDKGHEIVLAYLNGGDFFGEIGLFAEDGNRSALVRARAESEIAQISYAKLRGLTELYPRIVNCMAVQLARRLRNTNRKLGDLAFMDVYGRVARTLLDLSDQPDAMTHPHGMQVRVTRQELARLVGCSREMVGKVLKEMEEHKQVGVAGKNIVLIGIRGRGVRRLAMV
ncbi:MAG: cAMP-activated global transcriptional regulator CRP [Gammaproteobacteria bacterium]